jgi:hypothetical protein
MVGMHSMFGSMIFALSTNLEVTSEKNVGNFTQKLKNCQVFSWLQVLETAQ